MENNYNNYTKKIAEYFGRCYSCRKGKATNSELIAILGERIRVDGGEYDQVSK